VATTSSEETGDDLVGKAKREREARTSTWSRFVLFIRQVLDELGKVVTPTRSELVNYTLVVLVFVIIMMTLVSILDILFGWGVSWIFGDGRSLFG
jgi:preprotein translocase subunit SecE